MAYIKLLFTLCTLLFSLTGFADILVPEIPNTSFMQEHAIGLSVSAAIGIILLLLIAYYMRKK